MACFCHRNVAALDAAASLQLDAALQIAGAGKLQAMADWLALRALPAPAWDPDPAWLEIDLPEVTLSASAVATLTALAQLQVSARAVLGADVALSGPALPRLVATLSARLSALSRGLGDSAELSALCRIDAAANLVLAASAQGLFSLSAERAAQFAAPGGIELALWLPWLGRLQTLAPLIAVALQFGQSLGMTAGAGLSVSASLAASIRPLLGLSLPALGDAAVVGQLATRLSLQTQLQASLGAALVAEGAAAISAAVAAKVALALAAVPPGARPPQIALAPASFATPQVVTLALSADVAALAALDWQVPTLTALPSVSIGLAACMLAQATSVALDTPSLRATPCAGCDAASLLRAA